MTDNPDYYTVLGVDRDATRRDISHAYRALMRSHHPDMDAGHPDGDAGHGDGDGGPAHAATGSNADKPARNLDAKSADQKNVDAAQGDQLLRIMQAFNVLRDPERRAEYDRKLAATAPVIIPVRKVHSTGEPAGPAIRITPVRWESGPWA